MEGICKDFSGVSVLHSVDLELFQGEVLALVGENGAGKSTLMKILAGVYNDYHGRIFVDGALVRFASTRDAEKAGIAIIYQELNLVPELSVAENIFLGREPLGFAGRVNFGKMNRDATAILSGLHFPASPSEPVSSLRVGLQQIVEVAKALSLSACILVMDEPTSALSEGEIQILFSLVRTLKSRGVSIIYISHHLGEIFQIADRVLVLRDGARVGLLPVEETDRNALIRLMVGRELESFFVRHDRPRDSIVLEVKDLCLEDPRSSGRKTVEGVSFEVREGEIFGIAGLLGSGRTEILETLFGTRAGFSRGRIRIDGREVILRSPTDAIRNRMALITEDRKNTGLVLNMKVDQNLTLAALQDTLKLGMISRVREQQLAEKYVERLNIQGARMDQEVATLSGGNQQKVVLGKWLATRPRVLLMDEPTRGIDVGAKHEIYELLSNLAREGMAMVMASSELPELLALCDRILVMRDGKPAALFSKQEASQEKILEAAAPVG